MFFLTMDVAVYAKTSEQLQHNEVAKSAKPKLRIRHGSWNL
jgi:hypothetical protein